MYDFVFHNLMLVLRPAEVHLCWQQGRPFLVRQVPAQREVAGVHAYGVDRSASILWYAHCAAYGAMSAFHDVSAGTWPALVWSVLPVLGHARRTEVPVPLSGLAIYHAPFTTTCRSTTRTSLLPMSRGSA